MCFFVLHNFGHMLRAWLEGCIHHWIRRRRGRADRVRPRRSTGLARSVALAGMPNSLKKPFYGCLAGCIGRGLIQNMPALIIENILNKQTSRYRVHELFLLIYAHWGDFSFLLLFWMYEYDSVWLSQASSIEECFCIMSENVEIDEKLIECTHFKWYTLKSMPQPSCLAAKFKS